MTVCKIVTLNTALNCLKIPIKKSQTKNKTPAHPSVSEILCSKAFVGALSYKSLHSAYHSKNSPIVTSDSRNEIDTFFCRLRYEITTF